MIEVEQTITAPPKGNCLQACVTSLFDLSLDDVPNFVEFGDYKKDESGKFYSETPNRWWEELVKWTDARGCIVLDIPYRHGVVVGPYDGEPFPVIAAVPSLRGPWNHCIVACMVTGEILWDPTPLEKMTGVIPEDTQWFTLFVKRAL